jgi:hypothetical protein
VGGIREFNDSAASDALGETDTVSGTASLSPVINGPTGVMAYTRMTHTRMTRREIC